MDPGGIPVLPATPGPQPGTGRASSDLSLWAAPPRNVPSARRCHGGVLQSHWPCAHRAALALVVTKLGLPVIPSWPTQGSDPRDGIGDMGTHQCVPNAELGAPQARTL